MQKRGFLFIALLCLSACSSFKKADLGQNSSQTAVSAAPTQKELEALWTKAGTPGAEHKFLKDFAGAWKTSMKCNCPETGKSESSKGSAIHTMILGDRFLKEDFYGSFRGKKFQGVGLLGFDNVAGSFTSTWADSMSTALMISDGTYDSKAKTITWKGTRLDPVTKQALPVESVTRMISKNEWRFEMYDVSAKGEKVKTLEVSYTRAGAKAKVTPKAADKK